MPFLIDLVPAAARVMGLFLAAPFFSSRLLPMRFRLAFAGLIAVCLISGAARLGTMPEIVPVSPPPGGVGGLALLAAAEGFVGFLLGWASLLVMGAVRGAAALLSEAMGLSAAGVLNPSGDNADGPLRTLHGAFALFLFLTLDLHHAVLRMVARSFEVLPAGSLASEGAAWGMGRLVFSTGAYLFEAGLLIALPVVAALLLVTVAQGALARVVPELEFFAFGFPLRAILGLSALLFSLSFLTEACQTFLEAALEEGQVVLEGVAG
ncbi:MAG TPA: flagellar biosynthetic protein FliR [Planctomycetota bacterium]|nr:flagellar biosynthetic protein FliR [Planctomycetota bacterium]